MNTLTQAVHAPQTPRLFLAGCCLAALTLLSACGGQGSGTAGIEGGNSQNLGSNSTSTLAMAGAYQGAATGNSSEFVSFVTPSQQLYLLYALQAGDANVYPILYTGLVQSAGTTSATVSGLKSFQYLNNLRSGSAAVSGSSATAHTLALSNLDITGLGASPRFAATAIATTSNAQGTWVGTWADGLDGSIRSNTNLSVSASGASYVAQTGFGNCTPISLALTAASDAPSTPYFSAQAVIPGTSITGCNRVTNPPTSATLNGIGFIHASPVAGKTKRLELMLLDTTGSGISFRGDQ